MGSTPIRGNNGGTMSKQKNKYIKPLILLIFIIIIIAIVRIWDLTKFLELEYVKTQVQIWQQQLQENKLAFMGGYFVIYVLVTALSIPGATVLTLVGGALFGLLQGVIIVSFASTIGATCSFLVARLFLRDSIEKKFKKTI